MFIYLIRNKTTGMEYVGTTIVSAKARFREHLTHAFGRFTERPLYDAMRRDGREAFTVEVLHEVDTYDEMLARERDEIASRRSLWPGGYNLVKGGRGNYGWKMRPETRRKIAAKAMGRIPWNRGVSPTPEAEAKRLATRKGKPLTERELSSRRQNAIAGAAKIGAANRQHWDDLGPEAREARLRRLAEARAAHAADRQSALSQ